MFGLMHKGIQVSYMHQDSGMTCVPHTMWYEPSRNFSLKGGPWRTFLHLRDGKLPQSVYLRAI